MTDMLVLMNGEGQITIPIAVRHQLGLGGDMQFQVEVCDGVLVLRPALVIPKEDAWAYAPEHLKQIVRARQDNIERQLTKADLDRLAHTEA